MPVKAATDCLMANKILILDDEELIRETISSLLTSAGYVCRQCSSGDGALRILEDGAQRTYALT